jgi:hypothetical protein
MGWAAVRTTLFPTWLGVLVIAGSVAWVADPVILFGLPDASVLTAVVATITTVAELSLIVYLLVRGVRRPAPVPLVPQAVR